MTAFPRFNISFAVLLAEAIKDISEQGYDNPARLQDWLRKLRLAAIAWIPSEQHALNQMQVALSNSFKRAVSPTAMLRVHPGVSKFTIQQLEPRMRVELDRRILAATDLIKLNREQSVEKMLQRFSGWSTSIPAGGSNAVNFREVKEHIGKPIAQVKFEQRRVEIDQGHKLMSSISAVVAEQTGAIAMVWRSNWKQAGYDYRKDHKERDQKIYAIRGNWAMEEGLMKKGADGYLDEITQPAEEPFCRCFGRYITAVRDLPQEMLTQKGKQALAALPFRKR